MVIIYGNGLYYYYILYKLFNLKLNIIENLWAVIKHADSKQTNMQNDQLSKL